MFVPDADPLRDSLAELPRRFGRPAPRRYVPDTAADLAALDRELAGPGHEPAARPARGDDVLEAGPAPDALDVELAEIAAELGPLISSPDPAAPGHPTRGTSPPRREDS